MTIMISINDRFGKLVVLDNNAGVHKTSYSKLNKCRCDCGNITIVTSTSLIKGNTQSCGCLHKQLASKANTTHGMRYSKTYSSWSQMIQRCTNIKLKYYHNYGGRGISVCDRWKNSFSDFFNDMGERPINTTLDRINNDGNYEPNNCRWTTSKQQRSNSRIVTILEFNGEKHNITEWAAITGISRSVISARINRDKWPIEKALTIPVKNYERTTV